jgi:GTP-binding protein
VRESVHQLQFVGSFHEELPELGLPEVAFAGRSNVGKSSALNRLLGRKSVARTSSRPGRTQAINLFQLGESGVFADLPGYGYAKVPQHVQDKWKRTIESYLTTRKELRMVVVLVDARRDPTALDGQLLFALDGANIPALIVATKVDKLTRNERFKKLAAIRREFGLAKDQPVGFSAVTGEGIDEVWARLDAAAASARLEEPEG